MKRNRKLNENIEDLIFVFNTKELYDDGFSGSFTDFIKDIEDKDGIIRTTFDDEGNLIIIIFKISTEDIEDILSSYSVQNPEQFTQESDDEDTENIINDNMIDDLEDNDEQHVHEDDADDADDDTEISDSDADEDESQKRLDTIFHSFKHSDEDDADDDQADIIKFSNDDDDDDGDDDDDKDDEEIIVDDDADDDGSDEEPDDDDDDISDSGEEGDETEDDGEGEYGEEDVEEDYVPKGTRNLSEKSIHNIAGQVREYSLLNRISENFFKKSDFNDLKKKIDDSKKLCEQKVARKAILEKYDGVIKKTPFANVKVDGKHLYEYNSSEIEKILDKTHKNFQKYGRLYKKLDETLFPKDKIKLKKQLFRQKKLIKILELQESALKKMQKPILVEDNAMVSTGKDQNNTDSALNSSNSDNDDEATLTSIIFKVKNADDFIKVLTDNGVPAEALEKIGGGNEDASTPADDSLNSSPADTGDQNAAAQPIPAAGAPVTPAPAGQPAGQGANPFEGKKDLFINKLYEDNPFETDPGQTDDTATGDDTAAESGEGEEVKLKDTSYAKKIEEILAKVYNYPENEFNDKIGGEIIDDDQPADDDGSDEEEQKNSNVGDESANNKSDEDGTEEEINPEEVFGNI